MNYNITVVLPFSVQLNFEVTQTVKNDLVSWMQEDQEKYYLEDINNNINFLRKSAIYAIKIVSI